MSLALAGWMVVSSSHADIGVVTPQGQQLAAYLDSWNVQYWWPTVPVNWQTGSPNTPVNSTNVTLSGTHCSGFTTAAAWPLGIYILRPPIYPNGWHDMANYQDLWYKTNSGTGYGWLTIPSSTTNGVIAQDLANQGYLVIASYLNPNINNSGHTAIIHPFSNTLANISSVGAAECQAGTYNYNLSNVKTGFNQHSGAFPSAIDYFYHPVAYPITPLNPVLTNLTVSNGFLSCHVQSLTGRNYSLQFTTNFTTWTTALAYTNSNLPTTLFTTSNFTVAAPQTCSFGVRVTDAYGVVSLVVTQSQSFTGIILNGSSNMNINLGSPFVDPGATAKENCTTNLPVTTNGTVNVNLSGSYTLTYKATNSVGTQLIATRTVNVTGFHETYETSLASSNWSENFNELGPSASSLPSGWVFAQGVLTPVYSGALTATCTFSQNTPQTWTTNTSDENSQCFTRPSDSTTNSTLTSGGRVNCGDASTGNTNRAVGFATSNPSWESPTNFLMFGFVNNTGGTIAGASISYNIKRYKQGTNNASGEAFYYSTDGMTWSHVSSGDVGPYTATGTSYLFATQPEVTNRLVNITGLSVSNGSPFYLCWQFIISGPTGGQSASMHILALDDFSLALSNAPSIVIPPPLLQNVSAPGGNFTFSWSAVTGASYQVQFCNDVLDPVWVNLGNPITATNSMVTFSDPPAEDIDQRFYRVMPVEP